ncbi:thioredoxin family protein [Tepidibacter hydrothermalis]|uniref:Thioredoxin family protein n=1 Tax=Tepidibacter hydrothermalis TaxID=3036126 RepID=A0ABY8EDZ0_9FIRM|nr:thioredoxin family protein [Tepidibacter hydrothermalis]WFD11132.1 thioredoxin family protein [Tepidibacter hydrothermalis]
MDKLYTKEIIDNLIKENDMVLVYFGNKGCGVCNILKPRVRERLKSYPKIKLVEIDVDKNLEAAAQFNIFTIPAILIFIKGKESIRQARYINLEKIEYSIKRYYELFHNE